MPAVHKGKCRGDAHAAEDADEQGLEFGLALCSAYGSVMRNRPHIIEPGRARLIRGFALSYRRMRADRPAPTIMTNSSHVGSDFKLHPWEHRVLSIREVSDLQQCRGSFHGLGQ